MFFLRYLYIGTEYEPTCHFDRPKIGFVRSWLVIVFLPVFVTYFVFKINY